MLPYPSLLKLSVTNVRYDLKRRSRCSDSCFCLFTCVLFCFVLNEGGEQTTVPSSEISIKKLISCTNKGEAQAKGYLKTVKVTL